MNSIWRRALVAACLASTGVVGCATSADLDELESEEASAELSRRVDGRETVGSDALVGEWQVPFCAGGIPSDFRSFSGDLIGLRMFGDGTYEATRPSAQLGVPCAVGGRCAAIEVGTYAVRRLLDARGTRLGDRLVLRPASGAPREYEVRRGFAVQLSRPLAVVTPGAVAGSAAGLYPRSALSAAICQECADSQIATQRVPGDASTWTCVDRAGRDLTTAPEVIATASGGAVRTSATVRFSPASSERIRAVRFDATLEGDAYGTEIVLEHDGIVMAVLPPETFATHIATLGDDMFGTSAAGTWTLRVRRSPRSASRTVASITSYTIALTR